MLDKPAVTSSPVLSYAPLGTPVPAAVVIVWSLPVDPDIPDPGKTQVTLLSPAH
jgi:hypothetical protein